MTENKNQICKQFELLVWLYIDGDLPPEEISFWNEHLFQCETCNTFLNDMELLPKRLREELMLDISDEKFNRIINDVTNTKRFGIVNDISLWIKRRKKWKIQYKITFATTIAVVPLILFLVLKNLNEFNVVKKYSPGKEIQSHSVEVDIGRLEKMVYGKNWDVEIGLLEKDIHTLEKNSNWWFRPEGGKK